jgi:hypothetical protein
MAQPVEAAAPHWRSPAHGQLVLSGQQAFDG